MALLECRAAYNYPYDRLCGARLPRLAKMVANNGLPTLRRGQSDMHTGAARQ
jgi:hypothetical protein